MCRAAWLQARRRTAAAAALEVDQQLPALERQLSVDDILSCRQVAQRVLEASLAAATGMSRSTPQASATPTGTSSSSNGGSSSRSRRRQQAPASVALTAGSLGGASAAAAAAGAAAAGRPAVAASLGSSSSTGSVAGAASTAGQPGSGRRGGYLAWVLSKAAGFLRYMPYAASEEVR